MSKKFSVMAIPSFQDNYIWLLHRDGQAVVVDPGDAAPVKAVLLRYAWSLEAILITHHHADHQGGVVDLLAANSFSVPVYGPAREAISGLTHPLLGGESLHFPCLAADLQVLAVPGHTLGHLAYYGEACLFCGDTLFGAGCGRLFEGSPQQMSDSLAQLAALPDSTQVFCAHEYTSQNLRFAQLVEPENEAIRQRSALVAEWRSKGRATLPSTIALEKQTNPFLRCTQPAVAQAARRRDPSAANSVGVFAALRAWRNEF